MEEEHFLSNTGALLMGSYMINKSDYLEVNLSAVQLLSRWK